MSIILALGLAPLAHAQVPPDPDLEPHVVAQLARSIGDAESFALEDFQITGRAEGGNAARPMLQFRWRGFVEVRKDLYAITPIGKPPEIVQLIDVKTRPGTRLEVFGYALTELSREQWRVKVEIEDRRAVAWLGHSRDKFPADMPMVGTPEGDQLVAAAAAKQAERERIEAERRAAREAAAAAAEEQKAAERKAREDAAYAKMLAEKAEADRRAAAGQEAAARLATALKPGDTLSGDMPWGKATENPVVFRITAIEGAVISGTMEYAARGTTGANMRPASQTGRIDASAGFDAAVFGFDKPAAKDGRAVMDPFRQCSPGTASLNAATGVMTLPFNGYACPKSLTLRLLPKG